jgi:hypothetical protein
MRFALISLGCALLLAPLALRADGVSYNYLDAAYASVDIDDFSEDADGFLLRAAIELTDNVFVFGGYSDLSIDLTDFDIFLTETVDLREYDFGLGYAWPVGNASSMYGKVSYVSVEAESFGVSADDDGYGLAFGLRTRPATNVELEGYVDYVDLSDLGDETSFGAAARFFFTPQFALGAEVVFGEDSTSYGAGLRWHWGR